MAQTISLQTVPFRVKLSDVPPSKHIMYRVKAHTPGNETTTLLLLLFRPNPSVLSMQLWNHRFVFRTVDGEGDPEPYRTVVNIYPSVCDGAKLALNQAKRLGYFDLDIPFATLEQHALSCGHVILSVSTQFECDSDALVDLQRESNLDKFSATEPPACQLCSFVGDLPEPPKNAPTPFMNFFRNGPFIKDDFATFGIRVGSDELFVHPVVVSTVSPVFLGMLTRKGGTIQPPERFTVVHGAEPQHVRLLLEGIYDPPLMDTWEKTFAFLSPIYQLADYYGVSGVMEACKAMFRFVPADGSNICEVLAFADTYDIWQLVRRCCDCEVQKGLPRDIWQVDPGKTFKTDRASAFQKYANMNVAIKKLCECGPELHLENE